MSDQVEQYRRLARAAIAEQCVEYAKAGKVLDDPRKAGKHAAAAEVQAEVMDFFKDGHSNNAIVPSRNMVKKIAI